MDTSASNERWAVILAGGEGSRLRSLTRAIAADDRPKQFCAIFGGQTLLEHTRQRIASTIPSGKTLVVVTKTHELFYQLVAQNLPPELLLVQPENKGTALAILYALLSVANRSPGAIVAIFPSDHCFSDDKAFMSHVESAFVAMQAKPELVTLLGIAPDGPEVEYGWIEPDASVLCSVPRVISRARGFWEKPTANLARRLMERGCLWNSFVMVGHVDAFLKMIGRTLPKLYDSFVAVMRTTGTAEELQTLRDLYSRAPATNFSSEVLAVRPDDFVVLKVNGVSWIDLGDPTRVVSQLAAVRKSSGL